MNYDVLPRSRAMGPSNNLRGNVHWKSVPSPDTAQHLSVSSYKGHNPSNPHKTESESERSPVDAKDKKGIRRKHLAVVVLCGSLVFAVLVWYDLSSSMMSRAETDPIMLPLLTPGTTRENFLRNANAISPTFANMQVQDGQSAIIVVFMRTRQSWVVKALSSIGLPWRPSSDTGVTYMAHIANNTVSTYGVGQFPKNDI
jgi:hypothetical protein